jgi:hypothetical protein
VSKSRRPSKTKAPARKGGVPVILYVFWPIWGPIVLTVKRRKKAKREAKQVTTKNVGALVAQAMTDQAEGKGVQLRSDLKPASWHYRNRRVLAAAEAGGVLAASKLLVLGPWLLPLIGLLAFVALLVGAIVWLTKLSVNPEPEIKKHVLDRIPTSWPLKFRATLAHLSAPRTAGVVVVLLGVWWWATPLERPRALLIWLVAVLSSMAVRGARFQVRALDLPESTGTRETDWDAYIAGKGGIGDAKGSKLIGTADFLGPNDRRLGWTGGVVLPKGSAGATVVAPQIRARIATTYSEPGRPDRRRRRHDRALPGSDDGQA